MSKLGFYDYDSAVIGSDGVIAKSALTSLAIMPAGNEVGVGTNIFSDAGMTGEATSGYKIIGVAGQADLVNEGTLRFMVSKEAVDQTVPLANENWLNFKTGALFNVNKAKTTGVTKYFGSLVLNGKHFNTTDFWQYANSSGWELNEFDQVEYIYTWDTSGFQVWIDRFKEADILWTDSATKPNFLEIYLNALSGSGGTYTYRDLLITSKKTVIKASSRVVKTIHFYGDSYTQQGNYARPDTSNRQTMFQVGISDNVGFEILTEDGLTGLGFEGVSNLHNDSGMIPCCHRWLSKNGLFTHKIRFWGEGGSGIEALGAGTGKTIIERTAIAQNGNYDLPDVAVFAFGYNDAQKNTGTGPSDIVAYEVLIKAEFSKVLAVNPKAKIIICTLPFNTHVDFAPASEGVNAVNSAFVNAANAFSEASLVDTYALFGAGVDDGILQWNPDHIHPNHIGQAIYGKNIGLAIASSVR